MAFRRTYDEIAELIRRSLLDADLARDIVRKSGVMAGRALESTLEWLIELWKQNRYYNTPGPLNYTTGPIYNYRKDNPKKKSAADYDIEFMSDHSAWRYISIGTYDIYDHNPTWWGQGYEFLVGSNFEEGAGLFNHAYKTHPYIEGSTLYDPFPYPDKPCYFTADLKYISVLVHWYDLRYIYRPLGFQAQQAVVRPAGGLFDGPYDESSVDQSEPVILKLWASLDGGATWEAPFFNNPNATAQDPNAALLINKNAGPNSGPPFASTSGAVKSKFRRDGVLMKYTLEAPDPEIRIYLTHYGVRGYEPGTGLIDPQYIAK